jgi:hypothetical protein
MVVVVATTELLIGTKGLEPRFGDHLVGAYANNGGALVVARDEINASVLLVIPIQVQHQATDKARRLTMMDISSTSSHFHTRNV